MPPAFSRCATLVRALCLFLGCALLGGLTPTLHAAPGEPEELLDLCKLDALPQDQPVTGPAIIESSFTTIVVDPGSRALRQASQLVVEPFVGRDAGQGG